MSVSSISRISERSADAHFLASLAIEAFYLRYVASPLELRENDTHQDAMPTEQQPIAPMVVPTLAWKKPESVKVMLH